jgi:hypothetical protein
MLDTHKDKLKEKMDQFYKNIDEEIDLVKKYHYPLYGANNRINPEPCLIGTCLIIEINERFFLVTASHVINENNASTIYIGGGNQLNELTGVVYKTIGDDQDLVDIATVELSRETLKDWSIGHYVSLAKIKSGKECGNKEMYSFIGYPASKSKVVRTESNHVRSSLYSYFNTTCDDEVYKQVNVQRFSHILIGFDQRNCITDGEKMTFPKPNGISGGGVWFHSDLKSKPLKVEACLAGIAVKNCQSEKCFLAINIDAILQLLKEQYSPVSLQNITSPFKII